MTIVTPIIMVLSIISIHGIVKIFKNYWYALISGYYF